MSNEATNNVNPITNESFTDDITPNSLAEVTTKALPENALGQTAVEKIKKQKDKGN